MKTKIEWTDAVWNPVTGCAKVSAGCKNCYAERVAGRFWKNRKFMDVRTHPERLNQPLRWRKPRRIFVNSMSDLFHESVPDFFIDRVFGIMAAASRHTFQVLTKRPERMRKYLHRISYIDGASGMNRMDEIYAAAQNSIENADSWDRPKFPLPNAWLGVSVEDQKTADERIPLLLQTPAAVRFISAEPLLGPVKLQDISATFRAYLSQLDWVICGGESGTGARPFDLAWARSIRDQCKAAGVPFFMKQMGSLPHDSGPCCECWPDDTPMTKHKDGCFLKFKNRKGGDHDEWPQEFRVREFPRA